MRILTISLVTLFCLALAVSALAQGAPPQGGTSGGTGGGPDGSMAMKPYKIDSFLAAVDKDKDGALSKEEWTGAGLMDTPFSLCDSDKDNKITQKEFAACSLPEAMDTNKDGILTVDEMKEFDKSISGGSGAPGGGAPGGGSAPGGGGAPPSGGNR